MTTWLRPVLAASLALLAAAACGTATSSQAGHSPASSSATPRHSTSPAAGLTHSSLQATSWVSATDGWALAAQPCAKSTCTRLAHTSDGGQHWQPLPDPPAEIPVSTANCAAKPCVSQVGFASPAIGYLYGPALLMTTDGGLTWHAQPGLQTEALAVVGRRVYRVAYTNTGCPGPCQPALQVASVGSAHWRTLIRRLAEPGRSDSAQIVASGPDLLVAMYGSLAGPVPAQAVLYRSDDGGGTWRQVADPCTGLGHGGPTQEEDLIGLTAVSGGFFAGLCGPHNITNTFVITSANGGATWRPIGAPPSKQQVDLVAAASPTAIAVASGMTSGSGTYTAQLLVTTDGGQHWVTAATDTQKLTGLAIAPAWLGFETSLAGHWLADPHAIWSTTDGGLHWQRTAFR